MRPTVSVIIPTWNAAWCVDRALESVAAQTLPASEIEILVCDDESTDGTADQVERRGDPRVRVLRLPHRNASATRAAGLNEAIGEWLAFLDADDWWVPGKLELQLQFLQSHPEVKFLMADGDFVSASGVLRESWLADYLEPVTERVGDLFPLLVRRCFPLTSTCLVHRDAYAAVGGIDPAFVFSHDYDLWLRLAAKYPAALMTEKLSHYWCSPGSLSRRLEGRHRDDFALMERIARGELRDDPKLRRLAVARAAGLAFDLGLACLREGRVDEARGLFARATRTGPLPRRLFALAGRVLPAAWVPAVLRWSWLKGPVAGSRARPGVLETPEARG